jgi:sulfur carrier protein ThiS
MSVTIHMHGNLRRFMPEGRDHMAMDVAPGTSIAALLASLGADRDTWLVAVNGVACGVHRILQEGDLLDCFEPVAAG